MSYQHQVFQFTQTFVKAYKQLPRAIQRKVKRQLRFLAQDITHPGLRAKKMIDTKGNIWEARIDGRYRVTFCKSGNTIHLRAIGKHDIYQRP